MEVVVLRQGLITEVREAFELVLVDLLDNGVFYQGEHRLLAGEVLVKIVDVSFGFLWMDKEKVLFMRDFRTITHKNTPAHTSKHSGAFSCVHHKHSD